MKNMIIPRNSERIIRIHDVVVVRTSGSAMMFVGTSGVDSQMDMMHPMVTD